MQQFALSCRMDSGPHPIRFVIHCLPLIISLFSKVDSMVTQHTRGIFILKIMNDTGKRPVLKENYAHILLTSWKHSDDWVNGEGK